MSVSFGSCFARRVAGGCLIAVALVAATGAASAEGCKYRRIASLPYRWEDARMMVEASVGGHPVRAQVDTGAEPILMFEDVAERLQLRLAHLDVETYGVSGRSPTFLTQMRDLHLGRFAWDHAHAVILPRAASEIEAADSSELLVGSSLLLQHDMEIDADVLRFYDPEDCDDAPLGYWADDVPWTPMLAAARGDFGVEVLVQVDGVPVRAAIDTGSPYSLLDLSIARRLGFDPARAGPADESEGLGAHAMRSWLADFGAIAIGPEVVHRPTLRIADMWGHAVGDAQSMDARRVVDDDWPQMLLGADFVRTHRLLISMAQRRVYFSYVGGQPFVRPAASPAGAPPSAVAGSTGTHG